MNAPEKTRTSTDQSVHKALNPFAAQTAIVESGEVEHLWICADDEDRPKHLYARLGFRPALTTAEFLRLP